MSMSRCEQSNTSPPCTKPWTEWRTSLTTPQHTYWRISARTNWAGDQKIQWYWIKQQWCSWNLLNMNIFHPRSSLVFCSGRVPPFALLHGTSDIIVPSESSTKFSELLTSLSIKASLYLLPRVDHTEIVTDLMTSDRRFYHPIYSCIKQEYRKLMGTCWRPIRSEKHPFIPNIYWLCHTLTLFTVSALIPQNKSYLALSLTLSWYTMIMIYNLHTSVIVFE